ncbi:cytochrome C biogenesis protein [bacterium]|nr:cytochrome C biogenesis protein [bacterium]
MERISIVCFGGTYFLSLLADLTRLKWGGKTGWRIVPGLLALGLCVHGVYVAHRGFSMGRLPISTMFDSTMLLAWILAAIELYLLLRSEKANAVGLFITPLVLVVILVGGLFGPRTAWSEDWSGASRFWGTVHAGFLVGGAACTFVAFSAALMFGAQSRRLKKKSSAKEGLALPSLETSERINRLAITLSFPLLTFGLVIGVMLNYAIGLKQSRVAISWTDPKLLSAAAMWCVFAALLNARFRPAMRGRRIMWLTFLAFAFLIFTWIGIGSLVPTAHGKPNVAMLTEGQNP